MNDLVSVIVPIYKRKPDLVVRAVKSILAQTYRNIEVIVVDDSPSTYEYRSEVCEAVKALGDKVTYIQHDQNLGACAARNTGIINSKGEFVGFLDDDDEWVEDKLEKQMKKFADPQIGLVYCGFYVINTLTGATSAHGKYYTGKLYDVLMIDNVIGATSYSVIRKDIAVKAGMFDVEMMAAQDYEFWIRISKLCEIECVNEPLVKYYIHDGECITADPKKKIQGFNRIIEKNRDYLHTHKKALWSRTMALAPLYAWNKQYLKAIRIWVHAAAIQPHEIKKNYNTLKLCTVYIVKGLLKKI